MKLWHWLVLLGAVAAYFALRRRGPAATSNVSNGVAVRPGEGVRADDFHGLTV